jgi:hypothetical protein
MGLNLLTQTVSAAQLIVSFVMPGAGWHLAKWHIDASLRWHDKLGKGF